MNKVTQKQMISEKMYEILIKLYPQQYRKKYGSDMLMVFKDMLNEEDSKSVWWIVLKELPISVGKEYLIEMEGGGIQMNRNIFAISMGVISIVLLFVIFGAIVQSTQSIFKFPIIFHELNGFMSLMAWCVYVIGGVIVGYIAKKSQVISALITGIFTALLMMVIEVPDWTYMLGFSKHHFSVWDTGLSYYLEASVALIILSTIGGLIGRFLQEGVQKRFVRN